ncbi:YbaK/EbsC family protein [Thermopolyspora sp. NPDC052614]|uniref:YbaK/EbsC family protein n=1 Tax=Thermopolyspora sp. NPDC052614 TaxID=3155682 RepID=UPI00343F104B
MNESLSFVQALSRPDLLATPVRLALERWSGASWFDRVQVAEIDPAAASGLDLCRRYGLDPASGGNCLIVEARRGKQSRPAACLVPPGTKADLNGLVRRHLNARQVTMLDRERAITDSGMEYGSITVIGLPSEWPVLVDASLSDLPDLIIGSGRLRSKLKLPANALLDMTGAAVLVGLGRPQAADTAHHSSPMVERRRPVYPVPIPESI